MIFRTHIPDSFLQDHIRQMIYFKHFMPDHTTERVVPDGAIYLIFELDDMPRYEIDNETLQQKTKRTRAWISGLHKDYITINALPDSEMFVVQFEAHGLYPFIKQSVDVLSNQIVEPIAFFGDGVYDIRLQLMASETPEEKFNACEQWLSYHFSNEHKVSSEVLDVHDKIKSSPTIELNKIADLIDATGISKKHFTSLFKKYLGLTPKQFQRVIRFNEIMTNVQQQENIDWTQIALSCGFYDQSHFIKEFKQFCGLNPSDFITNYKDFKDTNFFPLD